MYHVPGVNFPVTKDADCGFLVKTIHYRFGLILKYSAKQQSSLLVVEELCLLRPVDNEKIASEGGDDGDETLDYENPAPSFIVSDARQFCYRIRKKLSL